MYASVDDIVSRLPERTVLDLADDSADGSGTLSSPEVAAVLAEMISAADNEIDGYLEGRYTLPLSSAPALLGDLSATLAVRRLFGRRPAYAMPETWKDEQTRAQRILEKLADGRIRLAVGEDESATAERSAPITTLSRPPLFTGGELEKF